MPVLRSIVLAGLLAATTVTTALAATWQWRDADGRMVYSDQPPPPDIKPTQILRGPPLQPLTVRPAAESPAAPAPVPAQAEGERVTDARSANAGPAKVPDGFQSWADKAMSARKRAAERQETERKERETREQVAQTARACEDARGALRALESGMRMVTVDTAGEQTPISDAERNRRIADIRRDIGKHCGTG